MSITKILLIPLVYFVFLNNLLSQEEIEPPMKRNGVEISPLEYKIRIARRHLAVEDYEKATIYAKQALEIEPKSIDSQYILSEIYVKTEQFELARTHIKLASPHDDFNQLFFLVDKCLEVTPASKTLRNQALHWAIEAKSLQKKPGRWFQYILANTYFRNNDLEKSLEIIKPLIEKDPKNSNFNILLGNIFIKKGEYEKAATYLSIGMNREPIKPLCNNHISYQLLTYDDEADNHPIIALSYAILASDETQQKIPDIEDTLALAYCKTGDLKNAVLAQERAVKLLRDELPPDQKNRSTKLMGFKKQLLKYEEALKKL